MSRHIGRVLLLALIALLAGGCGPDNDRIASPQRSELLGPGAEVDGMRLSVATVTDTEIFDLSCDPIISQPGVHERTCAFPHVPRLMIGYGNLAVSQVLLEREWQAQEWQLYLDGQEVDLPAFGTLPDRHYYDADVGYDVWVRLWAVTVLNPTPGQHTLRYVQSSVGEWSSDSLDATWTFTVVPKLMPR